MKRGLRLRLAFTHLAVAVLAVVVVALIANYAGSRRFDSYLADVRRGRNEAVVRALAETYRAPDGWDASAVYALSQVAALNNVDVAVYSRAGQLLFTVQGRHSAGMMGGGRGQGMMGGGASARHAVEYRLDSYPVVVGGEKVASAAVFSPLGARVAAESAYQDALARNLWIAALVASALALLVSLLVSRRITRPLEELTDAAADVAEGNLEVHVAPRGDDEVAALATAFNAMAERLARDEQWRREMTSDLSHELRTPLATIQSRVEALEDGVLPATAANLRVIGEEVERLGRLLGALRSLNDLESEDSEIVHECLDLSDVARDAVARAETAFAAKPVALQAELEPLVVEGDRDRLLQVVGNLLDNALKFTPVGGCVRLAVVASDGPSDAVLGKGRWARLTVTDNGPGIDPVDLPFIFDRFYRAQASRGTQGIGLGLAIVRGLVEAHDGSVAAANAATGGAVFTVYLPVGG